MASAPSNDEPLRSVHTSNFPEILEQLNISLLVTTYMAGKLVMLRPEHGVLDTLRSPRRVHEMHHQRWGRK